MNKAKKDLKVLVVGANGFLGKHICMRCLSEGFSVNGIIHTDKRNIPEGVKIYSDKQLEEIPEPYDVIFISAGNFRLPEPQLVDANVILPFRLAQKFPKSRIVYISSTEVYGTHRDTISLMSSFNNPSVYGQSKLAGELVLHAHNNSSIIRFSNLYGYGMNENLFIPSIITAASKNRRIRIYGTGSRSADYMYIEDAVNLCLSVAFHGKTGIFLGARGLSISNNKLAELVVHEFRGTSIVHIRNDSAPSFRFRVPKVQHGLVVSHMYGYSEGIKAMIQHYA